MEKIIYVSSYTGPGEDKDGLDVVNKMLEEGWKVKLISSCAAGTNPYHSKAYIVLEK